MKHLFVLLGMLISASQVYAQTSVGSLALSIQGDAQAYHIADPNQSKNYLLINDKSNATLYKLNAELGVEDSIREAKIDSKFKKNYGSIIENDQPVLFWSNNNNSAYISQKFDFNEHKYSTHEFELNLKKEKILCQFTALNQLYVLTVLENTSLIKVYKFTDSKTVKTQLINLSSHIFFDKDFKKTNLDELLKYSFTLEKMGYEPYELDQMDNTSMTPVSLAAHKKKFYVEGNTLTITLDHQLDYTELIRIDLGNYSTEKLQIKKPIIASSSRYELNSNSFVVENQLVQLKTSTQTMFLTVKDLDGKLIKEYTTHAKENMSFLNARPIIQRNNKSGDIKEVEKTSQFLKSLKADRIATTFYPYRDGYIINLGAVSPRDANSRIGVGISFGLAGGLIYAAFNYSTTNPMLHKFRAFADKQSLSASILTDKDFNAIPGTVQPTVYQNIHSYLSTRKFMSQAEVLFEQDKKMYLGYYDLQTKKYNFLEFE